MMNALQQDRYTIIRIYKMTKEELIEYILSADEDFADVPLEQLSYYELVKIKTNLDAASMKLSGAEEWA